MLSTCNGFEVITWCVPLSLDGFGDRLWCRQAISGYQVVMAVAHIDDRKDSEALLNSNVK